MVIFVGHDIIEMGEFVMFVELDCVERDIPIFTTKVDFFLDYIKLCT